MTYYRDGNSARAMAQGLGWLSLGLGVTELVTAGQLARALGLEDRTELIRAFAAPERRCIGRRVANIIQSAPRAGKEALSSLS